MIRILIADDHPLMAEGIKNTFSDSVDIKVVTVVTNGKEVLDFVKDIPIDVVLLDIDMPVMNGIDCAKELLMRYPKIKIAMLSMHQEKSLISSLIEAGVKGYMLKTIPKAELIQAIKTINSGGDYFNAEVAKALMMKERVDTTVVQHDHKSMLSERELEIVTQLVDGLTNIQIGDKLHISPRTVDTHRTNIMKKIGVNNVAGIIRYAFQNNIVS